MDSPCVSYSVAQILDASASASAPVSSGPGSGSLLVKKPMSDIIAGTAQNSSTSDDRRPENLLNSSRSGLDISSSVTRGPDRSRVASEDTDELRLLKSHNYSSHPHLQRRSPNAVPIQKPSASLKRKIPKPDARFRSFLPVNSLSSAQQSPDKVQQLPLRGVTQQLPPGTELPRSRTARRKLYQARGEHPVPPKRPAAPPSSPVKKKKTTATPYMTTEYGAVEKLAHVHKRQKGQISGSRLQSPFSTSGDAPSVIDVSGSIASSSSSKGRAMSQSSPSQRPPWMRILFDGQGQEQDQDQGQNSAQEKLAIRQQRQPPDEPLSEDELQALDVTVKQPSKTAKPKLTAKRDRDEEPSPFQGDLFTISSLVFGEHVVDSDQMMAVEWTARKAVLDPPQVSSDALPRIINFENITSIHKPEDSDSRTLSMTYRDTPGEVNINLQFDSRSSLDGFFNKFKKHHNQQPHRERETQRRKGNEANTERSLTDAAASSETSQNQTKRRKLVHNLQTDEGKIIYEQPSLASSRKTNGAISIPVKKYTPSLPSTPQRETRSMAQHRESDPPRRNLSPIVKAPPAWPKPLVFPKNGKKRAEVEAQDLERLRDDEFLNDNLIGLYTRFLEYHFEQKRPDLAKRIYFFNSYFYARLTDRPRGQKDVNYDAVSKWTRTVDLFSYDYVVVPINENAHWFLAIICNLGNLFNRAGDEQSADDAADSSQQDDFVEPPKPEDKEEESSNVAAPTSGSDETAITTLLKNATLVEDSQSQSPIKVRGKKKKRERRLKRYETDQPMIITFDSLGCPRQPNVRALKDYLVAEAKAKRGEEFDRDIISGMTAKEIPLQRNYSDCGLYLLAYLERFSQNPDEFVHKLLRREMNEHRDWPKLDSRELRKRFRDFLLNLHDELAKGIDVKDTMSRSLHVLLPPLTAVTGAEEAPVHGTKASDDPESSNEGNFTEKSVEKNPEDANDSVVDKSCPSQQKNTSAISSSPTKRQPTPDNNGDDDDNDDLVVLIDHGG